MGKESVISYRQRWLGSVTQRARKARLLTEMEESGAKAQLVLSCPPGGGGDGSEPGRREGVVEDSDLARGRLRRLREEGHGFWR